MTTSIITTASAVFTQQEKRRNSLMNKLLSPLPEYELCLPESPGRQEVEAFIQKRFQDSYGATIRAFYPVILAMRCFDKLSGTSGMRVASQEALFLEHYLDKPIECLLSENSR